MPGYGQRSAILDIQHSEDSLRNTLPLEKLYIHFDKPNYLLGDTIWYKAYVLEGIQGTPTPISGVVYVELIDGAGRLVQRSRQVLVAGSTYGEFYLNPAAVMPGKFTVRAYTRWLQNFGTDYFYAKPIDVSGDYLQEWTVNLAPVSARDSVGAQFIPLEMSLQHLNGKPLDVQPVTVALLRRGKPLVQERTIVDTLGHLSVGFRLPARQDVEALDVALRSGDAVMARFPLREGIADTRYDVQFLPESGRWLRGIPQVMGVKAIDENGLGIGASGVILDAHNREVAGFSCTHNGMGRVTLPALLEGKYRAKVDFPNGTQEVYSLPEADTEGVVLQHPYRPVPTDYIPLIIGSSAGFWGREVILTGQSRGTMHYGAVLTITDSLMYTAIPRAYFPEGIIDFSVLDASGRPLAARRIYNDTRKSGLLVSVTPEKRQYGTRDSVALKIRVTDSLGRPVRGNFSMAITDDSRVAVDTLDDNIYSRYFLSSEVKGYVEDPWYYFTRDTAARLALDNLLLTQGWVKYDHTLLSDKNARAYQPEPHFRIAGTVKNVLGKPLDKTNVVLFAGGRTSFFTDTLTNAQGQFVFSDIPPFDTAGFVIQARNKRNKSFNVGIDLEMDTQPPLLPPKPPAQPTWFVNLDTALRQRVTDQRTQWQQRHFGTTPTDLRAIMLQEVTVTGKRVVPGSRNLNGPGESDQALNEVDLLENAKKTLLQILYDKIDGFRLGIYPPKVDGKPEFMVNDKKARLIFDGMDLEFFYDPDLAFSRNHHMEFLKSYLEQYAGEDVLGVEVMYSMRYSNRYNSRHLTPDEMLGRQGLVTVYIEITTRNGTGPFMRKTPGVIHFRPMPFTWPNEFYRPRYPVEVPADTRDLRTTIHWVPMLFTDENGEATVSFYTADRPGSYTIRLEGTDGEGNFGLLYQAIRIEE